VRIWAIWVIYGGDRALDAPTWARPGSRRSQGGTNGVAGRSAEPNRPARAIEGRRDFPGGASVTGWNGQPTDRGEWSVRAGGLRAWIGLVAAMGVVLGVVAVVPPGEAVAASVGAPAPYSADPAPSGWTATPQVTVAPRNNGAQVGLRSSSKSGGPTIDVRMPDGSRYRIHVDE